MAEPTYTLKLCCHRCHVEQTFTGVSFPGDGPTVDFAFTCNGCGYTHTEVISRRAIPGQPGYGTPLTVKVESTPGVVGWKPETAEGTLSRPIDLTAPLLAADQAALRAAKEASPPTLRPAPADEWSKPVKEGRTWSSARSAAGSVWSDFAEVFDGEVRLGSDDGSHTAPRDVVLRLLAAEASDRLGWVWEVERFPGSVRVKKAGKHYVNWMDDPPEGTVDISGGTTDEILASLHGKFLLADALREAGQ